MFFLIYLIFFVFLFSGAHIGPEPTTDRFVVVMVRETLSLFLNNSFKLINNNYCVKFLLITADLFPLCILFEERYGCSMSYSIFGFISVFSLLNVFPIISRLKKSWQKRLFQFSFTFYCLKFVFIQATLVDRPKSDRIVSHQWGVWGKGCSCDVRDLSSHGAHNVRS